MSQRTVEVTLPVPGSANTNWRMGKGRMYKSVTSRAYRATIEAICRKACRKPLQGPVSVEVIWYRGRKAGDLDNRLKVLLDAISGLLYTDDSQVKYLEAERREDKANPRMVVRVQEVE